MRPVIARWRPWHCGGGRRFAWPAARWRWRAATSVRCRRTAASGPIRWARRKICAWARRCLRARGGWRAEGTRDLSMVLRRAERHGEAQTAARMAKAAFTRIGAEGEVRSLARQGWEEDFAAELRGSLAPLHAAQELADAGRYATLVTYLAERSRDELEQSPMLALLCGIGHSRLGQLDVGERWATVALARAQIVRDPRLEA